MRLILPISRSSPSSLLCLLTSLAFDWAAPSPTTSIFPVPLTATSTHLASTDISRDGVGSAGPLDDLRQALDVMQSTYFELWVGTWPTAIDWTAAVMNTHLASALTSYSKALHRSVRDSDNIRLRMSEIENELNLYFSQSTAYYFAEDAFAIRQEAYDDMLWVVLGWLDYINFIRMHSSLHQDDIDGSSKMWHGSQFVSAFAHRAHVFYEIARQGWDTTLCEGGMIWNPALEPYKNAITNELFISASVGMYLGFPGDNNSSPYLIKDGNDMHCQDLDPAEPHDVKFLQAAVIGYNWLKGSGMTNAQGLYTDGFHVSRPSGACNLRNEIVWTYNQGVLLSGLRGLWEGTGNTTYLEDGHELVRHVIAATGWCLDQSDAETGGDWAGLGRDGIMEDICDSRGDCSQDAQTFKGIFFHHFSQFCQPLPLEPRYPGRTHKASKDLASLHRASCSNYGRWVAHNAAAALASRDSEGRFGGWWGAGHTGDERSVMPDGAVDYRSDAARNHDLSERLVFPYNVAQSPLLSQCSRTSVYGSHSSPFNHSSSDRDLNDRGRGRSVETQGGGVAVLSTWLEIMLAESISVDAV